MYQQVAFVVWSCFLSFFFCFVGRYCRSAYHSCYRPFISCFCFSTPFSRWWSSRFFYDKIAAHS